MAYVNVCVTWLKCQPELCHFYGFTIECPHSVAIPESVDMWMHLRLEPHLYWMCNIVAMLLSVYRLAQ